jgi:uncharacterized membrane protein
MAPALPLRKGMASFRPSAVAGRGMAVAHPRFLIFFTLFALAAALSWRPLGPAPAVMAGFDLAALVFLASVIRMMNRDEAHHIRKRAAANDASKLLLVVLASLTLATVFVTVVLGLRQATTNPTLPGLVLPPVTLVIAWLFGSAVMALHYAHIFYDSRLREGAKAPEDHGGLLFPQTQTPLYWDFAYFSLNLGMTYQVSDVAITSPRLRRVVIVHCIAAFFFNIGVLALAISIIGSLVFQKQPI